MHPHAEKLILALANVPESTKACADRGDAAMFATLQAYYVLAADAAAAAGGRFIKPIGSGVLLTFPPDRAATAIEVLRSFQQRGTALWREFDERCHVQVKVAAGSVMCGLLGAPGEERFDVVGTALNALFKAPWQDFAVAPEVAALT
jgi:class 3 adenylate cyclase